MSTVRFLACSHQPSRLKQVLQKAAVHVNFSELFRKVQTHKSVAAPRTLLPILKTQLPYFITYAEPLKAPINPDYIIIISSLTDRLIYSATVIFIWYVTTRRTLGKTARKLISSFYWNSFSSWVLIHRHKTLSTQSSYGVIPFWNVPLKSPLFPP